VFARAKDRKASKGLLSLEASAVSKTTQYLHKNKKKDSITNPWVEPVMAGRGKRRMPHLRVNILCNESCYF
jgi:hypothetical protein